MAFFLAIASNRIFNFFIVIVLIFFVIWLPWSILRTTKYTFFRYVYLGLLIIKLSSEALFFFLEHPALKYLVSIFYHNKTVTMVVKLVYIVASISKLVSNNLANATAARNGRGTTSTLSSRQKRRLRSFAEGTEVEQYLKKKVAQTDVVSDDIQQRLPDDQQNLLENAPVIDVSDNDGHARSTGTQGGKCSICTWMQIRSFSFATLFLLVLYFCADLFIIVAQMFSGFFARLTAMIPESIVSVAVTAVMCLSSPMLPIPALGAMYICLTIMTSFCGLLLMFLFWLNVWFNLHITYCLLYTSPSPRD